MISSFRICAGLLLLLVLGSAGSAMASTACAAGTYDTVVGTTCTIGNLQFSFVGVNEFTNGPVGPWVYGAQTFTYNQCFGTPLDASCNYNYNLNDKDFYFTPIANGFAINLTNSLCVTNSSYCSSSLLSSYNGISPIRGPVPDGVSGDAAAFAQAEFAYAVSGVGGASITGVSVGENLIATAEPGAEAEAQYGLWGQALNGAPTFFTGLAVDTSTDGCPAYFFNAGNDDCEPVSYFNEPVTSAFVTQELFGGAVGGFYAGGFGFSGFAGPTNSGPVTTQFSTTAPVPEPTSMSLLGIGLLSLGALSRKNRLEA